MAMFLDDATIRATLPSQAHAVFDSIMGAMQGAEEIYGPGEEHYTALMAAVVEAARARLESFASYQTEIAESCRKRGEDEEAGEHEANAIDARGALLRIAGGGR